MTASSSARLPTRPRLTSPHRLPDRPEGTHQGLCAPPKQRLLESLELCAALVRELKLIENSGHARIGEFAKPLGDQQRCRTTAAASSQDPEQHLPNDPVVEPAFVEDDDATTDPFFHRFFDDAGVSTYEQLLRGRMRVLALSKLVYSRDSVPYVRAEVELAETYTTMNLWKQAHAHIMVATTILKSLDEARAVQQCENSQDVVSEAGDDSDNEALHSLLEFFYSKQQDAACDGQISKTELASWSERQAGSSKSLGAVFESNNLDQLFGAAPVLHWQELLQRMGRWSAMFQDLVHAGESLFPAGALCTLKGEFTRLDPSHLGVVPLENLIDVLDQYCSDHILSRVQQALRNLSSRIVYPFITWSEVVKCACASIQVGPRDNLLDPNDPARDLRSRLKFFFGRFFLRKGQLDDATRQLQIAIVELEQAHGSDSYELVPIYLAMAETLSMRFKQQTCVVQKTALEMANKWLTSIEGSRRVRAKVLDIVETTAREKGKTLLKKDAEIKAREEVLKEYSAHSFVRPDATAIEDAIEYCTKAWRIQDHNFGRGHITTASVHVTLAQIYANKLEWGDSIKCYEQAITIYEESCNGPVPASMWLKLELAKIHHLQLQDLTQAVFLYNQVGNFFHSFALEFAGSGSTRRESCAHAIDAWRQRLSVDSKATLEDHRHIIAKIHDATVDGYGEFSVEAAETGRELAMFLIKVGQLRQAERQLRASWYVLESHFGPNDRRSRKVRKQLMELSSEIKGAALDHGDDGGHEWLTI